MHSLDVKNYKTKNAVTLTVVWTLKGRNWSHFKRNSCNQDFFYDADFATVSSWIQGFTAMANRKRAV